MKITSQVLIIILVTSLLVACSVPGTYFSKSDIKNGYIKDGKKVPIHVIELDAKWLAGYEARTPQSYRIGPYDILNIIVWDHPELTTPTSQTAQPTETGILVDSHGEIFFPFAGRIKVAGLTLDQARQRLEANLKVYLRDPQVSVRVAEFRSQEVEIVGEVNKPGILPITDRPMTAMEAINFSGGVNSITANTQQIFILSENPKGDILIYWFNARNPASLLAAEKFRLHNNVIIYVPPAGVSAWNRVVTQLIPTLGGVNTTENIATD